MYKIFLLVFCVVSFNLIANAVVFNSPRTVTVPTYQIASASGDLNNDGFPDLITGGYPRQGSPPFGRIYVMLGKGNGSFQQPLEFPVGAMGDAFSARFVQQIEVADLDNDNNLDVIVIHNFERYDVSKSVNYLTVLFGNGNGSLQAAEDYFFNHNLGNTLVNTLSVYDMDQDGFTDIVFSVISPNNNRSVIYILKNLGSRNITIAAQSTISSGINEISAVNLNNDRNGDLILATYEGVLILYTDHRLVPVKYEERDIGIFEQALLVKDLNADGRPDFAVLPRTNSQMKVFINTPNGFPGTPAVYDLRPTSTKIQSADINSDGNTDLLIRLDSGFQVFYNTGNGTFNESQSVDNRFVGHFAPADFNLDGKIDLGIAGDDVGVLLNSPNNTRYYTDFSGDRKSDFTVYRPNTGTWWTLFNGANNPTPYRAIQFGLPTDKIVPGNYDGDNKADIAVYRDGVWYILNSSDNAVRIEQWGVSEDIPVPSDFDNDGAMNLAVYRPSSGTWYVKTEESFNAVNWGIETDKPVPADYDGDGKTDIAVYRPSNGVWYILNSKNGEVTIKNFGLAEDKPVAADYDGDGKSDIAVFRPSNGVWYIEQSSNNSIRYQQFGLAEEFR